MQLEVKKIVSGYGKVTILHGIDLVVKTGEITCVLGPNGAGKSTLMRAIAGQLPISAGEITFGGRKIGNLGALAVAKSGIGYVPQEHNVFAELSVKDNLAAAGLNFTGSAARIEETLRRFPILKDRGHQLARTLSGGERQTLAIANALVAGPKLLILDEPTAGLAPIFVDRIIDWVKELVHEDMSVIWVVEQDPEKILSISKTTYMIDAGRNRDVLDSADLLRAGRLEEMLLQPH